MNLIDRLIIVIDDNRLMLLGIAAIVAVQTTTPIGAAREIFGIWLILTATRVAVEYRQDRRQSDMFFGQLNPDGTWKVPTQERIRR